MALDYCSVMDYNINISKYKSLAGISYIKLPEELDHPRKDLIDIQNVDDNEFLNGAWSDTYILQTIIQEELQKLIKILQRDLILKI